MKSLLELRAEIQAEYEQKLKAIDEVIAMQNRSKGSTLKTGNIENNILSVAKYLSIEEIEKVILDIPGVFYAQDVRPALYREFQNQKLYFTENKISQALFRLVNAGKLVYYEKRSGRTPASYLKK